MDVFAHGLWTSLAYAETEPSVRLLAIGLSVAPDLVAFAPSFVHDFWTGEWKKWKGIKEEDFPKLAKEIPKWVYRLYDITHSIPLWIIIFVIWWQVTGSIPWAYFAWLGHILIDIPTHSKAFFPTPFLWPVSQWKINGINWGVRWFMFLNYGLLGILYVTYFFIR